MEVRVYVIEKLLVVEVQDSGVGISVENQKRLFNEVVQFHAKAHQGGGGSGLGLWISKKIVDMHGGSIGVRSEGEGAGCVFHFSLPLAKVAVILGGTEADSGSSNFNANETWPKETVDTIELMIPHACNELERDYEGLSVEIRSILIVDDSALNRKLLVKRFEKQGYSVFEADDGDVAVEFIKGSIGGFNPVVDVIAMDDVRYSITMILIYS